MSSRDFLYGFMQGFGQAGGASRLSSLAAQNIAGGKYYDPFSDPEALERFQIAAQTGIPALQQQFIERYEPYMNYHVPAGRTADNELAPLTMDQKRQQLFGVEPPAPTVYGMEENEMRNFLLRAAMEGRNISPNILSQYRGAFNQDISPLVEAFTPDQSPGYSDFIDAYQKALNIGTPFAQQAFMGTWGDFLGGATAEQVFPGETMTARDLRGRGFVYLPEDRAARLTEANYLVTPATQYYPDAPGGFYEVREPYLEEEQKSWRGMNLSQSIGYIEDRAEAGHDVSNLITEMNTAFGEDFAPEEFTVFAPQGLGFDELIKLGYQQLTPEQVGMHETAGGIITPHPDSPGWYAVQEGPPVDEGLDYRDFNPEQLARNILADDQFTPEEQRIWEGAGYAPFGHPENLLREGLLGFDLTDSRIYGTLNGEPVYRTSAGALVSGDRILSPDEIGNVIQAAPVEEFEMPENRRVTNAPDGRELYENMSGYLVYKDGTPFVDEHGNQYYIGKSFFGEEQRILSTGSRNVLTGQSPFGDIEYAGEAAGDDVVSGDAQNIAQEIKGQFVGHFGREPISVEELISMLEQVPDETIQQSYNMSKQELINLIRGSQPANPYEGLPLNLNPGFGF
jgi:hypothetical protein